MVSPLSIVGAMYMLAAGTAGNTRQEIIDALNFEQVFDNETAIPISDPFLAYGNMLRELGQSSNITLEIGI